MKASDFVRRLFNLFGTTSVQFNRRNEKLVLELSNPGPNICEIFAMLFCETHNPKVVSSNLTRATNLTDSQGLPNLSKSKPSLFLK
jgi:hypothetical protein